MRRKICLLWDIDGTLIWSGGAGERAFERAILDVYGQEVDITQIQYSGLTDRMIAQMLIEYIGVPAETQDPDAVVAAYLHFVKEEMASGTAIELPGVRAILEKASQHPDVSLGLLTGNMVAGAEIKTGHFGLWKYFDFGGFADSSPERNKIAEAARDAAAERNLFDKPDDIWVIGDTPHDITCGKHIFARTLAVATGKSSTADLKPHAPDALFENMEDSEAVWACLTAE